jgi:hypothetical protein
VGNEPNGQELLHLLPRRGHLDRLGDQFGLSSETYDFQKDRLQRLLGALPVERFVAPGRQDEHGLLIGRGIRG